MLRSRQTKVLRHYFCTIPVYELYCLLNRTPQPLLCRIPREKYEIFPTGTQHVVRRNAALLLKSPLLWFVLRQVPSPLVSVRCGGAEGGDGLFSPVLPYVPPISVALRVPRGIAWHRDLVAWGTVVAAAIGALYTLWSILSMGDVVVATQKREKKTA